MCLPIKNRLELTIINKMKKDIKTIYIAGAVTSDIKEHGYLHCYQKFENAEKTVAKYFPGAKIYNPMKLCKADWSWIRCMVVCLWVLLKKCDAVVLLDDYKTSKGAMIEFRAAANFQKIIIMLGQMIAENETAKQLKIAAQFEARGLSGLSKYYIAQINNNEKNN